MNILETIQTPADLKNLTLPELKQVAHELRQVILDTVLDNGGHLASSLGAVDIILAMHYVFDSPKDKFIFDVGHQCYAHKLLTGRLKQFNTLRKRGGIAGFPKRNESEYDVLNTGHASTSLSAACGLSRAMKEDRGIVVTVIGDGALTGGLAYEALNDGEQIDKKQIIILNDNSMSISESVGSTAKYLLKLHDSGVYKKAKDKAMTVLEGLDVQSRERSLKFLYNARNSLKYLLQGGMPFEQFGLHYFGPIDGNNLEQMIKALTVAKQDKESILLHVVTSKGKGYREAEENPAKYHGYSPSASEGVSFSKTAGESLCKLAERNNKVYAVTAAMGEGTGLDGFAERFPDRFADVGIAEGHAVTMAAGLALGGCKPYFAVYSSFLQRAYDSVIHDVCLQDLPVTICIDRAGLVPGDGETHQGIYDPGFLRLIPNMSVVAPKSTEELAAVLEWSETYPHPLAIRYPKGFVAAHGGVKPVVPGVWDEIVSDGDKAVLLAFGARMVDEAVKCARILKQSGIGVRVVNARFLKPLDADFLGGLTNKRVYTLEDNLIAGGFGSAVLEHCNARGIVADIKLFGVNDDALEHATVAELLSMTGLDAQSLARKIAEDCGET